MGKHGNGKNYISQWFQEKNPASWYRIKKEKKKGNGREEVEIDPSISMICHLMLHLCKINNISILSILLKSSSFSVSRDWLITIIINNN